MKHRVGTQFVFPDWVPAVCKTLGKDVLEAMISRACKELPGAQYKQDGSLGGPRRGQEQASWKPHLEEGRLTLGHRGLLVREEAARP